MDKSQMLVDLGERVKNLRLEKGLTQTELANIMGKDHPSLNKLENGKVNPSYIYLSEVAEGLGVTLLELLDF